MIFLRRTREKIERQHFNGASLTEQGVVTIIGYPAEWTERQREETLAMAREAGFPDVQGCEEPIGVLYFQHYKGDLSVDRGQIVLVYDFGGGTSDVAVVRTRAGEKPKVLGCGGANNLGGRNFDEAVYTLLLKQSDLNAQALDPRDAVTIRRAARTLKEKLPAALADGKDSVETTVTLHGLRSQKRLRLTSRDFEECCGTLIRMFSDPAWEALNRANISPKEIDISILAGGSARMHYVHKALDDMFPEDMVLQSLNPGEVVAKGLAVYGRVLQGEKIAALSQVETETGSDATVAASSHGSPQGFVKPNSSGTRRFWGKFLGRGKLLVAAAVIGLFLITAQSWKIRGQASNANQPIDLTSMSIGEVLKLAESGIAEAQFRAGNIYYEGDKVNKSYEQAAHWYKLAAEQDHREAQNMLGHLYYNGYGVRESNTMAFKLFMKSAENGCRSSQYNVAFMYEKGYGIEKNYYESYKWYYISYMLGDQDAKDKMKKLKQGWIFKDVSEEDALRIERNADELIRSKGWE